ncbi:hypothetical protein [Pedobacter sp. Leaf216]|nr:hypothetical protein [Pedobacter sp. Leaf216]
MNYSLHPGAFADIPTKMLAILICLIFAAMPVAGFSCGITNRRTKEIKK